MPQALEGDEQVNMLGVRGQVHPKDGGDVLGKGFPKLAELEQAGVGVCCSEIAFRSVAQLNPQRIVLLQELKVG